MGLPHRIRDPAREAGEGKGESFGGVDCNGRSKENLYERAREMGIGGRSRMSKEELARAIARKQGGGEIPGPRGARDSRSS